MSAPDATVVEGLRAADPDRYLSALYAPRDKRPALFALYAFNAEIAGIRDRIREPLPGEIRLQWWRDVIEGSRPADGHPVADALLDAIARFDLPRSAFANYLEARIFDLYDDPMPSRGDLEGYCGETASALIQLAALLLDRARAPAHASLAGHAGCAQAITGLLRLLPLHRARGQCYIPRDMLEAAGTTPEIFVSGQDMPAAQRAVAAMVALAKEHLMRFQQGAAALPDTLRPAFLPLAIVPDYLARISGNTAGVLTATSDIAGWKRHWRLFRVASKGW